MTPPHPSPLVERVAEAIRAAAYDGHSCLDDQRRAQALAAVRVVVEEAAEVCRDQFCEVHKPSYYDEEHEHHDQGVRACIEAIETLSPQEPEA